MRVPGGGFGQCRATRYTNAVDRSRKVPPPMRRVLPFLALPIVPMLLAAQAPRQRS